MIPNRTSSPIRIHKQGRLWIADAPAKINLFLRIHSRRPDGYHTLSTVMAAVNLFDRLTFRPSSRGIRVTTNHPDIPTDRRNTVVRAAALFYEQHPPLKKIGVRIHIHKRIPSGSGLGGGSSDAAAALQVLNAMSGMPLSSSRLMTLAARVGSDVPFFMGSSPALCTGRGERVKPIPAGPTMNIVLVVPPTPNRTADVYRHYQKPGRGRNPTSAGFLNAWRTRKIHIICRHLINDLQISGRAVNADVHRAEEAMKNREFPGTLMTGSGSALFGLCRSAPEARCHAHALRKAGVGRVFVLRTLS